MRFFSSFCLLMFLVLAQDANAQEAKILQDKDYSSYLLSGSGFGTHEVYSAQWMLQEYGRLQKGDTIDITFSSDVNSVCQSKGCWIRVNLDKEEVMVRFRDYGFFVPKDIGGKDVIVQGKAYWTEMSVKDQRHFAEDGGATLEEIEKIIKPKKTLSFLAEGVLIEP